jgi:superfamily II DNA or RNA helicase
MVVYYIIASNDQKYYYNDGKRISEEEGKKLGAIKRSPGKKSSPSKPSRSRRNKELVPCKSHQYRDKITNRCKNKKDGSPKKLSSPKKLGSPKKTKKNSKEFVPCKSHQYRDKITNRCKNKKDGSPKKSSPNKPNRSNRRKKELVPCKPHQERNPDTGRCKNKSDYKKSKKRPLVREPEERVKMERWSRVKKIANDCVKRSKLPLRDLQLKVVEYMEDNDGLLVVHGTGCGKTLTAITCSQCYLDKYPERGVVFVGPASLISNFKKEMKRYGITNSKKYTFYSYDAFMLRYKSGRPISLKNKFLIVDEAHNVRNPEGEKSMILVRAAQDADKRLLLTATPYVNFMTDFIPLINMIYGKRIVGTRKQFYGKYANEWLGAEANDRNIETFKYLLQDKVDMVDCKDPQFFPERIDHHIDVPMDDEYYERYTNLLQREEGIYGLVFANPRKFYNGYRRAVNKTGDKYYSSKIKYALPIFKKGKAIIFTNWVDFGIKPISEALEENNITYEVFSGDTPIEVRQKMVDDFNNNKFNVLVLTRAGGEGIDLKGVRSVIVLDPTWNDAGLQQIVGRAIRFNSHAHLPPAERKVDVYFMLLTKPEGETDDVTMPTGDKILYSIIEKKKEIGSVLLSLMKEVSI